MQKTIIGFLSGLALLVALPAAAFQGDHAGARMHLGQPDYERTVTGGDEAVLAHTKSPTKHTICANRHNTNHAIIHYDGNKANVGPGQCVLVEATYVTASSSGTDGANVFGWHHPHHLHPGE